MTLALLTGLGLGLGVCLLVAGLRPAPPTLTAALARLDQPPTHRPPQPPVAAPPPESSLDTLRRWLGIRTLPTVERSALAVLSGDLDADLAVTGTAADLHAGSKALAALTGLLTPALLATLLAVTGLRLPLLVPLWVSLSAALVGYLLPDLSLKRRAADTRRSFRTSVGGYLDLVSMRMASGSGLAEALHDAAAIGTGPAFAQIRGARADARTDGLTPAQALGRLGQQLQLPDLLDTGTRLRLVDASGAQAQTSLRAQAASLRDRELADAQGRANEQSQSMLIAQVVLGLGFVLFLGYPAVVRVLAT
jgi:Flp pilus assembly protein TadB